MFASAVLKDHHASNRVVVDDFLVKSSELGCTECSYSFGTNLLTHAISCRLTSDNSSSLKSMALIGRKFTGGEDTALSCTASRLPSLPCHGTTLETRGRGCPDTVSTKPF